MKLIVFGPSDIIWVYFMIAAVIATAGTIPVLADTSMVVCETSPQTD